jgi:hypothetical protein
MPKPAFAPIASHFPAGDNLNLGGAARHVKTFWLNLRDSLAAPPGLGKGGRHVRPRSAARGP